MFMENGREKLDMLKRITMAWWQPSPVLQIVAKRKQPKQRSDKVTLEILLIFSKSSIMWSVE